MKNKITHLLCERTDILVLFWVIFGGLIFRIIAEILDSQNLVWWLLYPLALFLPFMYFYIAIKFNSWRERYCKNKDSAGDDEDQ